MVQLFLLLTADELASAFGAWRHPFSLEPPAKDECFRSLLDQRSASDLRLL